MRENDKFKLTDEKKTINGVKVFRIEAISNFNDVKIGDLGGFVESEDNLSFEKDDISWVYDDSVVYGESDIEADSFIYKGSIIKDSNVSNNSRISHDTKVDDCFIQESKIQSSNIKKSESFSSTIGQAEIEGSEIVFSNIGDTKVLNSDVKHSETSYATVIENSHIDDCGISQSYIEDETIVDEVYANYNSRLKLDDDDLSDLENNGLEL